MKTRFYSTKTFHQSLGLSCCFRQWKATHSHCSFLHGYAVEVKLVFEGKNLDGRNWVMDFGGLKEVKEYLQKTFDHKTIVAKDDPALQIFRQLVEAQIIDLLEVDTVGCEAFARMIFEMVHHVVLAKEPTYNDRFWLKSVEVREHDSNSAIYERVDSPE